MHLQIIALCGRAIADWCIPHLLCSERVRASCRPSVHIHTHIYTHRSSLISSLFLHLLFLFSVLDAAESLCSDLQAFRGQSVDLSPILMRAVTNVVCRLVFNSTYSPQDPELQQVLDYNHGIVQTIARGSLVDIFPWLQVIIRFCTHNFFLHVHVTPIYI